MGNKITLKIPKTKKITANVKPIVLPIEGGYEQGYEAGYVDGKENGIEIGYNNGYVQGESVGFANGQKDGYTSGYNDGLEDGKQLGGGQYDQDFIDSIFSGTITELRTETTTIADHGCRGRIHLTKVVMPNVETIQSYAFYSCTALETVVIDTDTVPTLKNVNAFQYTPIANGAGYIYVPASLVDSYKTASNWSNYAAQFRAIEDYPDITQ